MSITNYPDADFTPNIPNSIANTGKQSYNPTGSFRFWAQKVLPTVYDDSLSYYEILTKVVNYLNAVIQNVDSLNESVDNTNSAFDDLQAYVNTSKNTLIMAYNKLQNYVNTYFDSLDVQEEINGKLDEMANDGSLSELLAPLIPDLVRDWLTEHITPTTPPVDNTLTISEAAADAKVTGERINQNYKDTSAKINSLDEAVFNDGNEITPTGSISEGWKLENSGYRVADSSYKLVRFRVFEGNYVKITSDHKFQFQSSTTITASGENYRVGETHESGEFTLKVPQTATYVIVSTPIENSNARVYEATALTETNSNNISALSDRVEDLEVAEEAINKKHEDTNEKINSLDEAVFNTGNEISATGSISEGWKLENTGYRVEDSNYKLVRYRVFEGNYVKITSDHKFQFQSSTTVTASGENYRVGETHESGEFTLKVPPTATYIIVSTPIENSNASVYEATALTETNSNNISALSDRVEDLEVTADTIGASVYSESELPSVQTSDGWRLTKDGFRVADSGYRIMRFRVFEGDSVKVISDDKWQFQNSTTINASGQSYRIGKTKNDGTCYDIVPSTATYVVLSTPIENSNAHVYKLTDDVKNLKETVATTTAQNNKNFVSLYNAYTSQVSDIPYTQTATKIKIGIDTNTPAFVTGNGNCIYLPIIPGTSIRVTKPQTPICSICFTAEIPAKNTPINHYTSMTGIVNTEFVAVSEIGDNYLAIYTSSTEINVEDCTFALSQVAKGTINLLPQLDTHMVNLLKYRPVGAVSKAYIALSCDDGLEPLATYTIPRIQYWNNYYNTNIPLHMALFDGSPVFANEEYTELIKDMCENHNCSIGIHGTQPYEIYSSTTALYAYLNKQWNTIIEKTGIQPTSVIYPHSSYNDHIMVMAAGFCGICGASGSDASPYTYKDNKGLYFYVGPKSNCYEVYRLSIKDTRIGNANEVHRIIDYAIANNLIICPYFHDIDFTEYSEETNNFNRAMLDAFIQYGMERGVEFINFGDIPKLL